jgi:hypothetical protein
MNGIGPDTLKHILYPAMIFAFVCVILGMIAYNRASKRKQRDLVGDNPASKEAGIAAARQAIESKGPNID